MTRGYAISSRYAVSPISDGRERERAAVQRRTCAEPGCSAILSVYNEGTRCALHAPPEIVDEGPRYEVCQGPCGKVLRASRYFAVTGVDARGRKTYADTCKVCAAVDAAKLAKPVKAPKLNAVQREQARFRERAAREREASDAQRLALTFGAQA